MILHIEKIQMDILAGILLTLSAHILARLINQRFPKIALALYSMTFAIILLWLFRWPFAQYIQAVKPVFEHLLGYVTVLLAVPLATLRAKDLVPLKQTVGILIFASLFGAFLPLGLAYALQLSHDNVLAYATRAVTTPIGLNIAMIIGAPVVTASMIIAFSGVVGAVTATLTLHKLDDRAYGLSLGLAAHAIGTVQAFYRSPVAARYAAFGMTLNGVLTALWLPMLFKLAHWH